MADIGEHGDFVVFQQADEFVERPGRVPDGPERLGPGIFDTHSHAGSIHASGNAACNVYTAYVAAYTTANTVDEFREHLAQVHARIAAACARAGRDPASVRLLPVSKTVPEARIRNAYAAGCRVLGENKVQEAHRKWQALADLPDLSWAIIGHLQTNKAKLVAEFASEFQALDSLRVAAVLDRHLQALGRTLDILVQVNTSGEASKFGLAPDAVEGFLAQLPAYPALHVRGFMTLALFSSDAAKVRPCFVLLREIRERMCQSAPQGAALKELSMGMSGDFEWAIEEGATIVRVGQAIFGARKVPDSAYWPTDKNQFGGHSAQTSG